MRDFPERDILSLGALGCGCGPIWIVVVVVVVVVVVCCRCRVRVRDQVSCFYRKETESYLYDEVGYPALSSAIVGIYNTTYAAVSVREYFARGFEEYVLGDPIDLKKLSPILFSKMNELMSLGDQ